MNSGSLGGFLKSVFTPFFGWWWAVSTLFATFFVWNITPEFVIIDRLPVAAWIFFVCIIFGLAMSLFATAWRAWRNNTAGLEVKDYMKLDDGKSVFLLSSGRDIPVGALATIYKCMEGAELVIALTRVYHKTDNGDFQAEPLWFSHGHQNDLATGNTRISQLGAKSVIQFSEIGRFIEDVRRVDKETLIAKLEKLKR